MREEKFRNKVSWMTFVFSVFVIWVHSYNVELFAGGLWGPSWERAAKIEEFVSVGLGQLAVPGFFLISSYLFFRTYTSSVLLKKWKGRLRSIVIPYVVWNSLYYLGYVLAARLPFVGALVGKEKIPLSLFGYLEAVLHYRYAPIFWYLYQLIFLIALSPVIYWMVKGKVTGLVYLAVLFTAVHFRLDMQHPNTDALAYYSAAAWMAVHGKHVAERSWDRKQAAAGLALLAFAVLCFIEMRRPGADVLWTVFFRLSGPIAVWLLVSESMLLEARPWMKQSLYLYAVHYVIVRFVNKGTALLLRRMLPEVPAVTALIVYFLLPVVVVCLSYGSAVVLSRLVPAVWSLLSGGRKLES